MNRSNALKDVRNRAGAALKALLELVSAIKVKNIRFDFSGSDGGTQDKSHNRNEASIDGLAHVSVCGHSHTVVCKVVASDHPRLVRLALAELRGHLTQLASDATPVLIAPAFSAGAQALCAELGAGFLDLDGNARLVLDEVFIAKRSLRQRSLPPASELPEHSVEQLEVVAA